MYAKRLIRASREPTSSYLIAEIPETNIRTTSNFNKDLEYTSAQAIEGLAVGIELFSLGMPWKGMHRFLGRIFLAAYVLTPIRLTSASIAASRLAEANYTDLKCIVLNNFRPFPCGGLVQHK